MWLTGLLVSVALADCPERLTPDELHSEVQALAESIAFKEPGARERLEALEGLLDGCIDGPLSPDQIARVWISGAVNEGLELGQMGDAGRLRLGSAYTLVGAEGWLSEFGEDFEREYLRAAADLRGRGVVELLIAEREIVAVDGDIVYARGPVDLPAGLHVVQWTQGGEWSGRMFLLADGETLALGTATVEPVEAQDELPSSQGRAPTFSLDLTLGLGAYASNAEPMEYIRTVDEVSVAEFPFKPILPLQLWTGLGVGPSWTFGFVTGLTPVLRGKVLYSTEDEAVASTRGYLQGGLFLHRAGEWGSVGAAGGVALPSRLTGRIFFSPHVSGLPLTPEVSLGGNIATAQAEQPDAAIGRVEVGVELVLRRRLVGLSR